MRPRFVIFVALLHLTLLPFCMAQKIPTLDQILSRAQDNVREFEFLLPNFICNEKITSQALTGSKLMRRTIIDSDFKGTQEPGGQDKPFTESREIRAIDGRSVGKSQQLTGPFLFGGGFSSILDMTFAQKNIPYHNYKITGIEKIGGKSLVVVEFATKADQKELNLEIEGRKLLDRDTGKAWIDPESMHVVRIECRYLNLPPPAQVLDVSVDYAKVLINGKTFWMPKTVRAEEVMTGPREKQPVKGQYAAEYSNYRKFEVSVEIKY
jgi:hypothetical protein